MTPNDDRAWVVGAPAEGAAATRPDAAARRAARLEARLAVYARYAGLVAAEAAAVATGDAPRAVALRAEREATAEHWAEMADAGAADADAAGAVRPFDATLDEALSELHHQAAADQALRRHLGALRDAMRRGAALAALPPAAAPDDGASAPDPTDVTGLTDMAGMAGALVTARVAGVGAGALAGHFPGAVGRAPHRRPRGGDAAPDGHPPAVPAAPAPHAASDARFDLRF
jgi:hypothetical protein